MAWYEQIPVAGIFALLFAVALLRGQATYWIARSVIEASGGAESPTTARVAAWLQRPLVSRARRLLEGKGLPVVALSYLTIGLQSAVLAAAGALRLTWWKFTIAQLIGALGWAAIYTTIGVAAWQAVLSALTWPMLLAIVGAVAVVLGVSLYLRRLRARRNSCIDATAQAGLAYDAGDLPQRNATDPGVRRRESVAGRGDQGGAQPTARGERADQRIHRSARRLRIDAGR